MPEQKTVNLAIQGGGSHGALTWGILDKLLEDGRIKLDGISATSAGAMNAAIVAQGLTRSGPEAAREALYDFWKAISDAGKTYSPIQKSPIEELFGISSEHSATFIMFDLLTKIFTPAQFNPFDINPLRDILQKQVDFDVVHECKAVKLFISATNVKTGKIKIFENKDISTEAILASACLPFLFPSVEVNGEYYWDGGYLGNPALYPLIYDTDTPDILILHINPIQRDSLPETAIDIHNRINEISFNSSLMREMRNIAKITSLVNNGEIKGEYKKKYKSMYMHAIRADISMAKYSVVTKFDVSWNFLTALYEEGRSQASNWLKNHFKDIGKKTTIDKSEFL